VVDSEEDMAVIMVVEAEEEDMAVVEAEEEDMAVVEVDTSMFIC